MRERGEVLEERAAPADFRALVRDLQRALREHGGAQLPDFPREGEDDHGKGGEAEQGRAEADAEPLLRGRLLTVEGGDEREGGRQQRRPRHRLQADRAAGPEARTRRAGAPAAEHRRLGEDEGGEQARGTPHRAGEAGGDPRTERQLDGHQHRPCRPRERRPHDAVGGQRRLRARGIGQLEAG